MRRKDREMVDDYAWVVFDSAPYCVVTFAGEPPYSVPLSPARLDDVIYFHCAKQGKKMDRIQEDPRVQVVAVSNVKPSDFAFTTEFKSGFFEGKCKIVEDPEEKKQALLAIATRYTPKVLNIFESEVSRSLDRTEVVRIDVDKMSAKRKKYDENRKEIKGNKWTGK